MTLLQLRYFCAVAEHQSISRAAKQLMVSQPALCKVIHSLEEELETPLFSRDKRSIVLNANGRFFYDNVNRSLSILDSTLSVMSLRRTVQEIHLCVNSGDLFMEDVIAEYCAAHDDVYFILDSEQNAAIPRALEHYDLAIYTSAHPADAPLSPRQHRLMTERFGLCVPAGDPLCTGEPIDLSLLADRNFLGTSTYGLNYQLCREAGFTPQLVMVGQQLHTYLKMLEHGVGISIVPELSFGHYLPSNCRFVPIRGVDIQRTLIIEEACTPSRMSCVPDFVSFCISKARALESAAHGAC